MIAIKKEKGYVLSYKGLEEKNYVMGEDRAVATVTGCVPPVERGAVLALGRMRERARPGDPTGSSGSRHVSVQQWKCKWMGRDICALRVDNSKYRQVGSVQTGIFS